MEPFPVPWEDLELEHVRAFLAGAGDEGLTWEAKGRERPHPDSVRKTGCGFANGIGGCLIVGAERHGGSWAAPGVSFRGEEPVAWLDQTLRDGLRPVPRLDVKAWEADVGHVAVVRVEPGAIAPCMTSGGEVYERVSGRTVKVVDPAVLARLFERGESALAQAEATALEEAKLVGVIDPGEPPFLIVGLGLSPTGMPTDISAKLFTEAFAGRLGNTLESLPSARRGQIVVTQEAVHAWTPSGGPLRLAARAAWNGGVGILLQIIRPEEERWTRMTADELFGTRIRRAARAATELVAELGGYGKAHVALRFSTRGYGLIGSQGEHYRLGGGRSRLQIQGWTDGDGVVSDELVESMKRELLRASGAHEWEPTE